MYEGGLCEMAEWCERDEGGGMGQIKSGVRGMREMVRDRQRRVV